MPHVHRWPRRRLVGAGGGHDHQRTGRQLGQDAAEHRQQQGIGPVQVAQAQQDRSAAGGAGQHGREGPHHLFDGAGGLDAGQRGGRTQQVQHGVDDALGRQRQLGAHLAHGFGHVGARWHALLGQAEHGPQGEGERGQRRGLAVGQAAAGHGRGARALDHGLGQLLGQPALAHAALALDGDDHRPRALDGQQRRAHQRGELAVTAHQREPPAGASGARQRQGLLGQPGLDRLDAAPHVQHAGRLVADDPQRRGVGGWPHEHAAGRRLGLQPGRQVHHVAQRRVVAAGPQRTHQHLAGGHADAQADGHTDLGGVVGHGRLHGQAGTHAPLGVVLVRHRRAEQRQDAVAQDLVDPAAVQVDVGHQPLEAPVDEPLHLLGIAPLGQSREPDHVGEQDRGHATLVAPGSHRSAGREGVTARRAERSPVRGGAAAGGAGHVVARIPGAGPR